VRNNQSADDVAVNGVKEHLYSRYNNNRSKKKKKRIKCSNALERKIV